MTKKNVLLAAFRGDLMCFVHVMLNAIDIAKKHHVEILLEGEATKVPQIYLDDQDAPFSKLWKQILAEGYIKAVCTACSNKMKSTKAVESFGLPLIGDMSGHSPLLRWIDQDFEIITF